LADTDLDHFREDLSKVPQTEDERYQFVFNQVQHALDQQASVLDNLRARANILLSAATVAVSFVVGLGLISKDTKPLPVLADVLLIAVLVGIGACAFGILWPREWKFTMSPQIMIEDYIEDGSDAAQGANVMYRKLALYLWANWESNHAKLGTLFIVFQVATGLLLAGVLILIIGLAKR
jgi:hypothetical protein